MQIIYFRPINSKPIKIRPRLREKRAIGNDRSVDNKPWRG